jgi:hypothetical protein
MRGCVEKMTRDEIRDYAARKWTAFERRKYSALRAKEKGLIDPIFCHY